MVSSPILLLFWYWGGYREAAGVALISVQGAAGIVPSSPDEFIKHAECELATSSSSLVR
jgi:hypothetical protein